MATQYSPKTVNTGLVSYLDAANTKSYISGSTTWVDLSGNGNNFTLFNSPTYDGTKLTFNGVNQYAECVNTECGNFGSSSYSLEYCTNTPPPVVNNYGSILMKRVNIVGISNADAPGWGHRSTVAFFVQDDNPGSNRSVIPEISSPLIDNFSTVSHNVMTLSRSGSNYTINFYINNVLTGTKTGSFVGNGIVSNSFATRIMFTRGENVYVPGDVYFVRMYNKELTRDEITQNFNAIRGRFGI